MGRGVGVGRAGRVREGAVGCGVGVGAGWARGQSWRGPWRSRSRARWAEQSSAAGSPLTEPEQRFPASSASRMCGPPSTCPTACPTARLSINPRPKPTEAMAHGVRVALGGQVAGTVFCARRLQRACAPGRPRVAVPLQNLVARSERGPIAHRPVTPRLPRFPCKMEVISPTQPTDTCKCSCTACGPVPLRAGSGSGTARPSVCLSIRSQHPSSELGLFAAAGSSHGG